MKESFDDKLASRIRKALQDYQPEYPPDAWEKFSKQLTFQNRGIKKYTHSRSFWISAIGVIAVIFSIYKIVNYHTFDKSLYVDDSKENTTVYPNTYKNKNDSVKDKKETYDINKIDESLSKKEYKIETKSNNPLLISTNDKFREENNERNYSHVVERDFRCIKQLIIPIQSRNFEVLPISENVLSIQKEPQYKKSIKHLNSDGINIKKESVFTTSKCKAKKTILPDKIFLAYSPEIQYEKNLKTVRISQGIGINFEKRLSGAVAASVGMNYQKSDFSTTKLNIKVAPSNLTEKQKDTLHKSYYIDSVGVYSGNYAFFEFPIMLDFTLIKFEKSDIKMGVGISPIAFLQESYAYEIKVGDKNKIERIKAKAWENVNLLGAVNFKLAYNYLFNNQIGLEAALIYKQNTGAIGANSMKLNRLGFQLGITCQLQPKD